MSLKDWMLHVWDAFAALFPPRLGRIPHRLRDNPAAHFRLRESAEPREVTTLPSKTSNEQGYDTEEDAATAQRRSA